VNHTEAERQHDITHVKQSFSPADSSPEGLPHMSANGHDCQRRPRLRGDVCGDGFSVTSGMWGRASALLTAALKGCPTHVMGRA
jgi:hypothetical protein